MLNNILVPLDGSPLAETILSIALRLAKRGDSTLTLLTVVHRKILLGQFSTEAEAHDYLDNVRSIITAEGFEGTLPISRVKLVVANSLPGEEIGDSREFEKANLILMSSHGHNPQSRLVVGSVASKLLQRNCCPLVVFKATSSLGELSLAERVLVPNKCATTRLSNRVVLALDGSESSEGAIPAAVELSAQFGAELNLLIIIEPNVIADDFKVETEGQTPENKIPLFSGINKDKIRRKAEARQYLESIAQKIQANNIVVRVAVEEGNPSQAIYNYSQQRDASILVMATRAGGPHNRFRLGSVADDILRRGGIPVMVVPAFQTKPGYLDVSTYYNQKSSIAN